MRRTHRWFIIRLLILFPYYGYSSPVKKAAGLLGIPYREDGARNLWGQYTTFRTPGKVFPDPGFNCSGFLVSAARSLLGTEQSLKEAARDRHGDSGDWAPMGKDWDFGLDLILNLSDGFRTGRVMGVGEKSHPIAPDTTGQLGFSLHDEKSWEKVLPRLLPNHLYFAAISKPYRKKGYQLIYYHVAMLIPENRSKIWFYHSTRKAGSHRINLAKSQGMELFHKEFSRSAFGDKYIYIIETRPGSVAGSM